jgi:hypothetical protein
LSRHGSKSGPVLSFGPAGQSILRFWISTSRLQSNFIAAEPPRTEDRNQQLQYPGNVALIELDSDNRASFRRLFDRYPCLHGSVAAVIEGGMGRVFADAQQEPCVALAILDFHFLAGDPLHANAPLLFKLLQPGDVVIAPTPAWQHLVAATYPSALAVYRREAFQAEQFDIDKLRRFCQALPSGFELRQVRLEEVTQFATDLDPALVYNFRSHEEFIT